MIDDEALYWIDRAQGGIQRHDRATGETSTLTAVSADGGLTLASNGTSLFWDDSNESPGLRSVRLSDGQTRSLGLDLDTTGAVVADEDTLYLGVQSGDAFALAVLELQGGSPPVLFESDYVPLSLAVDGDGFVYGTSCWDEGVWRVPVEGGMRETVARHTGCPRDAMVEGEYVYFSDDVFDNRFYRVPRDGGARGNAVGLRSMDGSAFVVRNGEVFLPQEGIMRRVGDGFEQELGPAHDVVGVAADEGVVYWLEQPAVEAPLVLRQVAINSTESM